MAQTGRPALEPARRRQRDASCAGRRWVLLLREHLWYFDATCLSRLFGQYGFEILERSPNRVTFSMTSVFRRLGQYHGPLGRASRLLADNSWMERRGASRSARC